MKKIYVFMDRDVIVGFSPLRYIYPVSHDSVIKEMEKGADTIYTHDPSFFQFDTLNEGYDAIVLRGGNGIVLSELLDPEKSQNTF
ncbi:MAG: hypothetical protein LBK61_05285 [Spirochaetaceae bacterium]|jgi:hypothetical protein|nr:hypothetical protein [Spirochaetaceae bacterium]